MKSKKKVVPNLSTGTSGLIGMVNKIILGAISRKSYVIRILIPRSKKPEGQVLEIDAAGNITQTARFNPKLRLSIVSRLKIMASASIAEHRRLQTGVINFNPETHSGKVFRVIFACFPALDDPSCEEVVMTL